MDIVSLVNRQDEAEDRVVLRVRMHIRCATHGRANAMHIPTSAGRWDACRRILGPLAVSADPLSDQILSAPLVVGPAADTERLGEESLAELSMANSTLSGPKLSELVSPDEEPSRALGDLSVVDARFTPALLDAALRNLVDVWGTAVAGSESPLAKRASPEACEALLRPGPDARLVVRDLVLRSWVIKKLHLNRTPPAVDVELHLTAVRYVMRFGSALRAGSTHRAPRDAPGVDSRAQQLTEVPWHLIATSSPAADIPGWP